MTVTSGQLHAELLVFGLVEPLQGKAYRGMPAFLVSFVERHDTIVTAGLARSCGHVDARAEHQVWHVAAWNPGLVVCEPCAADGRLNDGADTDTQDWTCDRCGLYQPHRVSCSVFQAGPFLLWFGICRDCGNAVREELSRGHRS